MRQRYSFITLISAAALSILTSPLVQADEIVTCKSHDYEYTHCRTGSGSVSLQRKLSSSPCEQGRSWDYDNRGVWVDNGCQAEFLVETGRNDNYRHDEYRNDDYQRDDGETMYGVTITRNIKRNSNDYRSFNSGNLKGCVRACADDRHCRSFNFGKERKDCHLKDKNNVVEGVHNTTVISGEKKN
jgi:hypothetical protein